MTLHLKLKQRWFREILAGTKRREFRRMTDYWRTRLEGRTYERVCFRNGYAPDSPLMEVEWLGLEIAEYDREIVYAIVLGKILRTQWLTNLPSQPELPTLFGEQMSRTSLPA